MQPESVGEHSWAQSSKIKTHSPQARINKSHALRIEMGKCLRAEQVYEDAHAVTSIYIFKNIKVSSLLVGYKGELNNLRGVRAYLQHKILR
jgi:hypothetical protein